MPELESMIEQKLIEQLVYGDSQWTYRKDLKTEADLWENFRYILEQNNKDRLDGEPLSDQEFEQVKNQLQFSSFYKAGEWLVGENGKVQVHVQRDTKRLHLVVMNHEHIAGGSSVYEIINQYSALNTDENSNMPARDRRFDVTLLINGLPMIHIELKNKQHSYMDGFRQIKKYIGEGKFTGIFSAVQMFVISNGVNTKYFSAASDMELNEKFVSGWLDQENNPVSDYIDFAKSVLSIPQAHEMIARYTVLDKDAKRLILLRPYQIHAIEAVREASKNGKSGFIWHTTGSGKTLTSYKTTRNLLMDIPSIDKAIFLIDRKDLDTQTTMAFQAYANNDLIDVDETDNVNDLKKKLKSADRQVIVTTIQKMANAVKNPKYAAVMDAYKNKKVVFIIDECHRSQFGKMHGQIKKHFERANYIGFTGTPIFEKNKGADGRTTADVFYAGDKLDSCLHRYMIKDAIADGNVLRFSVEYQRTIFARNLAKGIDPEQLDDPEYCKRHKIDMEPLYHDDERIASIAKHIFEHHEQHVHPQGKDTYTALFAVDSIPTLGKYYDAFQKLNETVPAEKQQKIAAIFSYQANEDMDDGADEHSQELLERCIQDYNAMYGTAFGIDTFDPYRKDIAKRLKQKVLPQVDILIVVNMYLTGLDAKSFNTLYLHKKLVWHSLVQAYSRTNRIDKVTKQFGQIVTYRNIKKWQDEALTLFSGDGDPNEYLLEDYAYYLNQWMNQNVILRKITPDVEAAGQLQSEDEIRMFIMAFRALAKTLATLKTFSKFDWADLGAVMDENEYEGFKSWYLYYKDQTVNPNPKVPVPVDVDFDIELVRTDRINVVYILNLLKNAKTHTKTEEEKQQDVDLILREIERSDNESLRLKKEVMRQFILTRFYDLPENADVMEAFNQFEKEQMQADMEEFAFDNQIDYKIVSDLVSAYTFSGNVSEDNIRERLMAYPLGLLKVTKLTKNVKRFIQDTYKKYKAEGETE